MFTLSQQVSLLLCIKFRKDIQSSIVFSSKTNTHTHTSTVREKRNPLAWGEAEANLVATAENENILKLNNKSLRGQSRAS